MSINYSIVNVTEIANRTHRVEMYVMTRPDSAVNLLGFYTQVVGEFAFKYGARLVGAIDAELSPFSEGAHITFEVKAWKHPERHRGVFDVPRSSSARFFAA